jgi:hypothetical protein
MSFLDLIRKKSQKTKDEDKDKEYFIKVLKLGILELEKSKVPRKAIIKLLAPLRLSEKKEILRKVDEYFLEDMCGDDEAFTSEKQLPSRRDAMTTHDDWYYLANCQYLIEQEIKDRHENKMKRLNERRKSMIKLVRINNK